MTMLRPPHLEGGKPSMHSATALRFAPAISSGLPPPAARPHLAAAIAAVLVAAACLCAIHLHVRAILPAHLAEFARRTSPIKLSGNVLQECAFSTPNEMPIYGSSELDRSAANRPDEFFRDRPTGFSVFPIGRGGTTCLMLLQKVAAAGAVVRGKKTAVFLSPTWFSKEEVGENAVDGNLTADQVSAWVFSRAISAGLKQKIALRLQDYPESLEKEELLTRAMDCLANPTPVNRLVFQALTPCGWLQNLIYQQLEYCSIWREIIKYSSDAPQSPAPSPGAVTTPDWDRLAAEAERRDRATDHGVSFSAAISPNDSDIRKMAKAPARPVRNRNAEFAAKMLDSKEWDDLGLLMEGLKELGADALFVDQPFNGIYRDLGGTTQAGRKPYYDKLARVIAAGGFPLQDYPEHEEDRFFFNDTGHPSGKAWIYYDHGLDDFYRGTHS
jgi:D-alanine transfer protein